MKQALFFLILLVYTSCQKESAQSLPQNKVLILKVDFQTYQFEGAIEKTVTSPFPIASDSIPLGVELLPPLDFGHIKVWYEPNFDSLFSGSIIAIGEGQLNYPTVQPANNFSRTGVNTPRPDSSRIRYLAKGWFESSADLDSLWMDIADLEIVSSYINNQSEIAYVLYTPGVWSGDPATWDYYIFMNTNR